MDDYRTIKSIGFQKERFTAEIAGHGMDALLLTSPENVFYTTGYTVLPSCGNPILYTLRNRLPYAAHVDAKGKVTLVCWGFSLEGVSVGADEVVGINTAQASLEALVQLIRAGGGKGRIGIESTMSYATVQAIAKALPSLELADGDAVMKNLRLIKTKAEIEQITRSTRTIEKTVAELFSLLRVGMSRLELIREAKYRLIKNGADGISHATFAFGKDNPEIALDEKLERNNLVTLDLGGILGGYCSDTRRYAFTGKVPDAVRAQYDRMVKIIDGVGDALRPGATYAQITKRALELFDTHGEQHLARMTHVGHNIGLETEEEWIDDSDREVRPGMVINIELYTTAPSFGQIGNEETFVVEEGGPRRVSQLPRTILEL